MHSRLGSLETHRKDKSWVLHSNFLPDSCESCLAPNQVSTKSRCLTITPRFTVICRDTDFRPNLRHLCLTRNARIGGSDRVGGSYTPRHRGMELLKFIRLCEFLKSGKIFTSIVYLREEISLFVNLYRSYHLPSFNWSVKNVTT